MFFCVLCLYFYFLCVYIRKLHARIAVRTIENIRRLDAWNELNAFGVFVTIRGEVPQLENGESTFGAATHADDGIARIGGRFSKNRTGEILLEGLERGRILHLYTIGTAVDIVLVIPLGRVVALLPRGRFYAGYGSALHKEEHALIKFRFQGAQGPPQILKVCKRRKFYVRGGAPLTVCGRMIIARPGNPGREG